MPKLIPASVPIGETLIPVESDGYVVFHLSGQEITFDRLDHSGVTTSSSIRVSTTPDGRSTKAIGALSLQDGTVGVWWIQHDAALDNDRLLFKQVHQDGTLGPTQIAATANTTQHVVYDNVHATLLNDGQVVLSADRVGTNGSSNTPTYSTFTSRLTPGGTESADLATVVSRDSNSAVSTGLVALADGGYVVTYATTKVVPNKYATSGENELLWYQLDTNGRVFDNLGTPGSLVHLSTIYAVDDTTEAVLADLKNQNGGIVRTEEGGFAVVNPASHLTFAYQGTFSDHYQNVGDGVTVGVYGATGGLQNTIDISSEFETTIALNSVDSFGRPFSTVGTFASAVQLVQLENLSAPFLLIGQQSNSNSIAYSFANAGGTAFAIPQYLDGGDYNVGRATADGGVIIYEIDTQGHINSHIYNILALDLVPSSIQENSNLGSIIGEFKSDGSNVAEILPVLGGPDAALFRVVGTQLALAEGVTFDYETAANRSFTIDVKLTNGTVITVPFAVAVADIEEPPTDLTTSQTSFKLEGKYQAGESLATLKALDPDHGEVYTYTLTNVPIQYAELFQIVGDTLLVANATKLNAIKDAFDTIIEVKAESLDGEKITRTINLRFATDDNPTANVDVFRYDQKTKIETIIIDVLANDVAPSAAIDLSSLTLTGLPDHGTARVVAGGKIEYTPSSTGFEPTSFSYAFKDVQDHKSNTGSVRIERKSGVPDPFVVGGIELKEVEGKGYLEATGDFTIGRSDGTGELLNIKGGNIKVYADRLDITNAIVTAAIGGVETLSAPIFTGNFSLAVAGAKGIVTEKTGSYDELTVATLDFAAKQIQLDPNSIQISSYVGFESIFGNRFNSDTLVDLQIDSNGIDFSGGVFKLPDTNLTVPLLGVTATSKGVGLTVSPVNDSLKIQGTFELEDSFYKSFLAAKLSPTKSLNGDNNSPGVTSIKLDLGDINDAKNLNFLSVTEDPITHENSYTGKGTLSFPTINLHDGFVLKDLSGSLESTASRVALGGSLKFGIPFGAGGTTVDPLFVEAGFEVVVEPRLELNKINFGISNADIPIPQIPGLSLTKLAGRAEGLASGIPENPNTGALTIGGSVGFSYGTSSTLKNLPDWLGIGTISGVDANFELDGRIQTSRQTGEMSFAGTGTFFLIDPKLLKATIGSVAGASTPSGPLPDKALINFASGAIDATASINVGSFFSGVGKLKGDILAAKSPNTLDLTGSSNVQFLAASATGTFTVPVGPAKGNTFANASLYAATLFDGDPSNDTVGISANVSIGPGVSTPIGVQIFLDGSVSDIMGGSLLPHVGSWAVSPNTPWITMSAAWENRATTTHGLLVTYKEYVGGPVLESYTETEFARHNIAIVDDLSGEYGRTVAVFTPKAGVWDVYVADPTGLGAITYDGLRDAPKPTAQWHEAFDATSGTVLLQVQVANAPPGARIDVYADTDGTGYDGTLISGGLSIEQAAAGTVVDLATFKAGTLSIYAVVRDTVSGLTYTEYSISALGSSSLSGVIATPDTTAPLAQEDFNTGTGIVKALTGNLLTNDSDASSIHLSNVHFGSRSVDVSSSGTSTILGDYGSLTLASNGDYIYQPRTSGHDAFTYTVVDAASNASQSIGSFDVTKAEVPASLSFGFALTAAQFVFSNGNDLMTAPDGTIVDLTGVGQITFTDGTIQELDSSPLVDDLFYAAHNLDVWRSKIDPDTHYAEYGWHEGRDPSTVFSTTGYLIANRDVADAGINPLSHHDIYGRHEGRNPSENFSDVAYLAANPDVARAGINALTHYLAYGEAEDRFKFLGATVAQGNGDHLYGDFNATFYLRENSDVAQAAIASGINPDNFAFTHYLTSGATEGRDPDAYFSTKLYLSANADVAAAKLNPLLHYEQYGWYEGRDPGASFHTDTYLTINPDVAAAQIDPLQHYLQHGLAEGRVLG